jgi:hypothetical protein
MIQCTNFLQRLPKIFWLFIESKGELPCSKEPPGGYCPKPKNVSTSEALCNIREKWLAHRPTFNLQNYRLSICSTCSPCLKTASFIRSLSSRHVVAIRKLLYVAIILLLSQTVADFHKTQNEQYAAWNYPILIFLNPIWRKIRNTR